MDNKQRLSAINLLRGWIGDKPTDDVHAQIKTLAAMTEVDLIAFAATWDNDAGTRVLRDELAALEQRKSEIDTELAEAIASIVVAV